MRYRLLLLLNLLAITLMSILANILFSIIYCMLFISSPFLSNKKFILLTDAYYNLVTKLEIRKKIYTINKMNLGETILAVQGKDLKSAQEIIKENNFIYRIVRVDNIPMVITDDFKLDRLNLEIYNGIIQNCYGG